ncbi:protein of unknown function [Tenacibaculum sp. 190524A02b]
MFLNCCSKCKKRQERQEQNRVDIVIINGLITLQIKNKKHLVKVNTLFLCK